MWAYKSLTCIFVVSVTRLQPYRYAGTNDFCSIQSIQIDRNKEMFPPLIVKLLVLLLVLRTRTTNTTRTLTPLII